MVRFWVFAQVKRMAAIWELVHLGLTLQLSLSLCVRFPPQALDKAFGVGVSMLFAL